MTEPDANATEAPAEQAQAEGSEPKSYTAEQVADIVKRRVERLNDRHRQQLQQVVEVTTRKVLDRATSTALERARQAANEEAASLFSDEDQDLWEELRARRRERRLKDKYTAPYRPRPPRR